LRTILATAALLAALSLAACGGDDETDRAAATPEAGTARTAADPGLGAIKGYLLEHTEALSASTAQLAGQAERYRALVGAAGGDYGRLLGERRAEVAELVGEMQATWRKANPEYEEMEGVVAGVPELSEYDTIIDAGADGSDPENAVPFDVNLPSGKVLRKPGNFFFLTETSLFGTNPDFQAKGAEADLDGDGEVAFPEALPDADHLFAFTRDFAAQARKLDASAKAWTPARADAFQALVTMTPTMSEYFGQWKNSRFIAGNEADKASFAAASRLNDIEDILSGLVLIYDNIRPAVEEADRAQAEQTGRQLERLLAFATDLRKKEQAGTRFDAEQADTLGAEAQGRAEAIAGQVSQAAGQLGVELGS
jgi:hypothetical protein